MRKSFIGTITTKALSVLIPALMLSSAAMAIKGKHVKHIGEEGKVWFTDAKVGYSGQQLDTMITTDPKSGDQIMRVIAKDPEPATLDGENIFLFTDEAMGPVFTYKGKTLRQYVMGQLKKDLLGLSDGIYELALYSLVVDKNGNICYMLYKGVTPSYEKGVKQTPVPMDKQKHLFDKMVDVMSELPAYKPAVYDGKVVHSLFTPSSLDERFKISGGKLYLAQGIDWKEL
jgi:hypothetical protein